MDIRKGDILYHLERAQSEIEYVTASVNKSTQGDQAFIATTSQHYALLKAIGALQEAASLVAKADQEDEQ